MLESRRKAARERSLWLNGSIATVVVLVALIGIGVQANRAKIAGSLSAANASVKDGVVFGKKAAATVDVYEDFQCPACAQFESILGPTLQNLGEAGKAKVVYHVKNFLDDNLGNDSSTRAGNAAFCASDAGRFQEFHNQVFAHQPAKEGAGYTDETLKGFAQAAGISGAALTTWQKCLDAGTYVDYVNSVEHQSFSDGVRGTPTIRINGSDVELQSIGTPELLTQAIQNATK
jgi:protein-disulfide isomerase